MSPGCSGGSCRQGRAKCETPTACQLPEPTRERTDPELLAIAAACAIVFIVVLALSI